MRIPVFYMPEMVASDNTSFSHSAGKPVEVVDSWLKAFGDRIEVCEFPPATREQLHAVHNPRFVDEVLACRASNGFGNRLPSVAASLPYTSGSMLAAAREAVENGKVACSTSSGFHHASYDNCFGFCTFNGLMVAAKALLDDKRAESIGILDYDAHWGNGTDAICKKLFDLDSASPRLFKQVAVLDDSVIHSHFQRKVVHRTSNAHMSGPAFLDSIEDDFSAMRECDLILYQAGADMHCDDPVGGFTGCTTTVLRQRDARVFELAKLNQTPIAWNLAGGYQTPLRKVLDIHDNTMRECIEKFG